MKKLYLAGLLIILAFFPYLSLSQDYHIIGDEESSYSSSYAPFVRLDAYSVVSVIYTQNEMEDAKLLTHIAFDKIDGGEEEINNAIIYVKHTEDTVLNSPYFYDLSNYTKVWEGTFPNGSESGWYEVELETYFEYNGVENLQFLFIKDYEANTWDAPYWRFTTGVSTKLLYMTGSDNIPESAEWELWDYIRPNIRFQFDEAGPLSVSTVAILDITNTTSESGGKIYNRGDEDLITSKGICWNTTGSPTVDDFTTSDGVGEDNFSSELSGLSPLTTYYVRAYVEYDDEIYYGQERVFTTNPNLKVETYGIEDITYNSATSGGSIIFNYLDEEITSKGVCWNTSGMPTINDDKSNNGEGEDSFTSEITGLNEISEYYVRAYAVCDGVAYYGEEIVFQTLPESADEPTDTDGNGYRNISSLSNLLWLSINPDSWSEQYELDNDIDASDTENWYSGKGFSPIGNGENPFAGDFYGNGYAIENLHINRPNQSYVGFFGFVTDADINDLSITDADITGGDFTAALAGYLGGFDSYNWDYKWIKVDNCSVTGSVTSSSDDIGGMFGYVSAGIIHNVYSNAEVSGNERVGGLFGTLTDYSEVRRAYSVGNTEGTSNVGGFAGIIGNASSGGHQAESGAGFVFNCYSHSDVTGVSYVGGFAGGIYAGSIYYSFSTGLVEGSSGNIGGFLGYYEENTYDLPQILSCYWDKETSGQETSAGGDDVTGKTTSEMYQEVTFEKYNFSVLWQIDEDNDYPEFQDASLFSQPVALKLSELNGSGTTDDPYIITNLNEFNAMKNNMAAHYKLADDIDMTSTVVWDYGRGWGLTSASAFTGSFDGDGYTVSDLYTK